MDKLIMEQAKNHLESALSARGITEEEWEDSIENKPAIVETLDSDIKKFFQDTSKTFSTVKGLTAGDNENLNFSLTDFLLWKLIKGGKF